MGAKGGERVFKLNNGSVGAIRNFRDGVVESGTPGVLFVDLRIER